MPGLIVPHVPKPFTLLSQNVDVPRMASSKSVSFSSSVEKGRLSLWTS